MKTIIPRLLLIALLLLASATACIITGGDDGDADRSDTGASAEGAFKATATYGAEQFNLQLTQIARDASVEGSTP